jgi:hypothetical protein
MARAVLRGGLMAFRRRDGRDLGKRLGHWSPVKNVISARGELR